MPVEPDLILANAVERATLRLEHEIIDDIATRVRIELICRSDTRALVRFVMACCLAKIHRPAVDIRKPYTEIEGEDTFSGRHYDETWISVWVREHHLPCNSTTAFLTPALRNHNQSLTRDFLFVGRPANVYAATVELLNDIADGHIGAADVLAQIVRVLRQISNENRTRMESLLSGRALPEGALPLSAEMIWECIDSHLRQGRKVSRLPTLVVAAAYESVSDTLGQNARDLASHNAADKQTGAIGDLEIVLQSENRVVTGYEMKLKRVTREDIDLALAKILDQGIENYLFITTEPIDPSVSEYAATLYERTGGVEIAVLDCLGFLRHFLHFFHRSRLDFLEAYERLVLAEPTSAVSQPLKELWLALRRAAQSNLAAQNEQE